VKDFVIFFSGKSDRNIEVLRNGIRMESLRVYENGRGAETDKSRNFTHIYSLKKSCELNQ